MFRQASNRHLPKEWANRENSAFLYLSRHGWKEGTGYEAVKSLFESDFAATFFDQTAILQMLEDHRQGKPNLQRKSGRSLRS